LIVNKLEYADESVNQSESEAKNIHFGNILTTSAKVTISGDMHIVS
jgi:hypothetical protein